jgi:hypothetical protein
MGKFLAAISLALLACTQMLPARGSSLYDGRYSIMAPEPGTKAETQEPWLAPKYKSPRGTRQHVHIPRPARIPRHAARVPPPIVVPQTGAVLPNLPAVAPSGPNGSETYQDRAMRCAHQAGVYGPAAGEPGAYVRSCINQ